MDSEWKTYPLSELTENFDNIRVPVKGSDRKPGVYPYYGASGIVDYIDSFLFDGEYLLIAEDGENLRSRNTPIAFMAKGKFWVNNHAHIVRANEKADTKFLCYYLENFSISGYLTGSTIPKLTQGNLNLIPVYGPGKNKQEAIATVLSILDDKIELNRRMNETLEAMAKTLFKSWFVDFDPVRTKADGRQPEGLASKIATWFPDGFEKSELGEIPKGWTVQSLYDFAEYINGAAYRNIDFSFDGSGTPIIKIAELKAGITNQTKFTNKELDVKYKLTNGDILFSWSGSPDTSIDIFIYALGPGWLNQHIFNVISEDKVFVYYMLRFLKPVFIEVARNKQTTGLGHVTGQDLRRLPFVLPTKQILKAFDDFAGPIFDKTLANVLESANLLTLRDSLLPKLMSGEVLVQDAEKLVESQR